MKNLQDFITFISSYPVNHTAVDTAHAVTIFGLVVSHKPADILELGFGTGLVTYSIYYATQYNQLGQMTCVDNLADHGTNPAFCQDLTSKGVRFLTPVQEQAFLEQCPSDSYDFIMSDADHFGSGLWISETLRVARNNALIVFHDILPDIYPNSGLILQEIEKRGLSSIQFKKDSRPGEQCWRNLLVIRNSK